MAERIGSGPRRRLEDDVVLRSHEQRLAELEKIVRHMELVMMGVRAVKWLAVVGAAVTAIIAFLHGPK